MINDKHKMIVWHVDDLKVSNIDSFEITKFAEYLSIIYGGLAVHRLKVHYYLVMDLHYSEQVTVKLSMINYPYSVLQEFPYHLVATAATLEADHL